MRMIAGIVFATVLLGAAHAVQGPSASAEDLYVGAIAKLRSLPQEPYLSYVMTHSQTHGDKPVGNYTQQVVERRADRSSWSKTIAGNLRKVGDVSIGRHYLIPDAFLPYRNDRLPAGVLPGLDADNDAMRTIATVHSALSYVVSFVGDEALDDCGAVAHLKLTPRRDPQRYNIRDLWVRRSDFRLCKAIFASRLFQDEGKGRSYPTIDTVELNENGLISSFSLFVQIHMLVATYALTDDGTFSHTSWANGEPAYLFDYSAWKASGAKYNPAL